MGFAWRQANDRLTGIGGTRCAAFAGRWLLLALAAYLPLAAQQRDDWPVILRSLVDQGHPDQALTIAEEWIASCPEDLEARGWHTRLLAWNHRWPEAEAEYKSLLERAPGDADLLMELARLLKWQQRYEESLRMVERACAPHPAPADCDPERARLVQWLEKAKESPPPAKAVATGPAKAAEKRQASRHVLRLGGTADLLSYTDNAGSAAASLESRWNERWGSLASLTDYERLGQTARSVEGSVTYRFTATDALTLGGGGAGDQAIVPRLQAQLDYDHGFRLPGGGFVRGVEADYQQRWLWYRGARALSLAPTATLYLPKDWNWLIRAGMTRLVLSSQTGWKPAALTRLTFPLHRGLTGQVLVATGTENFGTVDQVLWRSTRAVGGGLRIRLAAKQELVTSIEQQRFAPGRSETSLGITYGFRF